MKTIHENLRNNAEVLSNVQEGMDVYDHENNRIGTVESVYFGGAGDAASVERGVPATGTSEAADTDNALRTAVSDIFDPRDELPEEIVERLQYNGFVRVDRGWFGIDRYVMPEQIASVNDEGVFLSEGTTGAVEN